MMEMITYKRAMRAIPFNREYIEYWKMLKLLSYWAQFSMSLFL